MQIFKGYTFALTLLKINCNKYVESIKEISNGFMKEFILNKFNEGKYASDSYLITNNNINQCIININSINKNLDIVMNDKAQKLIDYYIQNIIVPDKKFISHNITFTFVIGLHDRIRYISENFLTDNNINSKDKYKNQILFNAKHFWNYINLYVDSEPLLKTDFFKSIIIKIYSCCAHMYYYNKDDNNLLKILNYFENLSKKLYINENTPSYELVWKVKGDYYFKKNDYNRAISFYNKSVNKMNDINPKKPVIYFNLGVLYCYIGNKNASIENLKKAAEYFKRIEEEKSTFDFHKRNNILTKKYNLTQYYIKEIQNN
jgi:tetratricopeptide (TPR) repeat protein